MLRSESKNETVHFPIEGFDQHIQLSDISKCFGIIFNFECAKLLSDSFHLDILASVFPMCCGLKYFSSDENAHVILLRDGKFVPPINGWSQEITYIITEKGNVNDV